MSGIALAVTMCFMRTRVCPTLSGSVVWVVKSHGAPNWVGFFEAETETQLLCV
jgi:hypothetical protein